MDSLPLGAVQVTGQGIGLQFQTDPCRHFADVGILFKSLAGADTPFGIGILVYHLFQRYKTVTDRGLGFVLLLIFVFLAFAFLDTSTYQDLIPHHFLMAVAFAFLVFGMYFTNLRLLVNRATVWIGKISFSLYLVHFGMLRWLQAVFPHGFPLAGDFGMLAGYILLTVLAIIVSAVTYNLVERPGMDLGKYIIERLETAREYRRSAVNQSE